MALPYLAVLKSKAIRTHTEHFRQPFQSSLMKCFIAKLVYRIVYGDSITATQFSEQLRLVFATDSLHAFTKAQQLGHKEEHVFAKDNLPLVQWSFIDVCELIQVNEMADGAELLSLITEPPDAKVYVKQIHRLSSQLLADSCNKCFQQN